MTANPDVYAAREGIGTARKLTSISRDTAPAVTLLGVDPGLDRTGYAVLCWPAARIADAGVIRTTIRTPLFRRLGELAAGLDEILDEHDVDRLAVEDLYAHYRHPRTAILMGHARGVILLAAARREIDVISLGATRIKKTLTGNGHASKAQVQRAVAATLRLPRIPEPPDLADAMAAAACAAIACLGGHRGLRRGVEGSKLAVTGSVS